VLLASSNYRPVLLSKFTSPTYCIRTMSTPPPPSFDNVNAARMTGILTHSEDKYDGVIISSDDLPNSLDEFMSTLNASITYWRSTKRRGVWLKVPIEKAEYIAPAVAAGFVFHHAEREYLMLNHWLSEEENRMPHNATHQVGVGSVVIHEGKILAVQEKNGPLRGTGIWKMPTGLSDAGEDLCDAAVREVLEETGIETEFVGVLSIRQSHTALFGKSDLFFICLLRPKTTQIQMQAAEIVACEWLDADQFLSQKFFLRSPLFALVHEELRHVVKAVSEDPTWSSVQPAATTEIAVSGVSGANEGVNSAGAIAQSVVRAVVPPVPSMVASRLPNGIRPGQSVLYHMVD
jgi:ADP-ribose pyrophosphatase YjhB (NUDIX family)